MSAHTPGPWHIVFGRVVESDPPFGFGIFPDKPTIELPPKTRQHSLASANLYEHSAFNAFYDDTAIKANARLIAAAPDLLTAAKMALDCAQSLNSEMTAAYAALRAAIAKAEGQS